VLAVQTGELIESDALIVGYNFDMRTNEITAEKIVNPKAGAELVRLPSS
jgi:hypothetical protein